MKRSKADLQDPAGATAPADLRPDAGLAAVEFALIAPLFLAILFGIFVYGLSFGAWLAVRHAAAEGARAAVAGLNEAERKTLGEAAVDAIFTGFDPVFKPSLMQREAKVMPGNNHLFEVTVTYDLSSYGLSVFSKLLPVPATQISATSIVPNGGY
ncbi:TadE family protein [Inquilinus sp.]|jgi:hypothetical protein|uniref:TadE family protein n=1 Tax=Inquilinus sp. TaxID=1932117 RepID=UPI003782E36C